MGFNSSCIYVCVSVRRAYVYKTVYQDDEDEMAPWQNVKHYCQRGEDSDKNKASSMTVTNDHDDDENGLEPIILMMTTTGMDKSHWH